MEKRIIVTVAVGENGQKWADYSHPLMRRYAEQCGADFFVLSGHNLKDMWPGFSKLLLGSQLKVYDRMLYLDSDILVSPTAPNLFDFVPPDSLGATVIDSLPPEVAPAVKNGWISNDIKKSQKEFGDIQWSSEYFNSGAMLFCKEHLGIFESALSVAKHWFDISTDRSLSEFRVFADQTLFNYFAKARNAKVFDIGYKYNHTPAFNAFGHRYHSNFYHYVRLRPHRRGDRLRQMKIDSWILKNRKLHDFLVNNMSITRVVDKL
ncbi:glycosyltransferase [Reinekea marinisedimentorum]|uniref:Glycosyl transferase family 8 n=1 Tax=Reinekea marinisedimentorum TaxID=230495 RepID=A0A4R3I4X1_9GAMM|nr:glycosyltransferase [Reinekea marinisedimentorum]TCS40292.1 glycosyl transferase family 8 [Reinekea marinisedimentorum]